MINNSLINEVNNLSSGNNDLKLKRKISDINKTIVNDKNNPNNQSIVSYKSVQKQFDEKPTSSNNL